jgi:FG-GAP-like repeat/Calx-beta domain/Bacterial pre-peptidase C-terminal domain
MHINLIPDSTIASAPSGFTAAVQAAATMLEQAFTDNVTINIRYGWGSANNVVDPKLINSGGAYAQVLAGDPVSYATVRSWLLADATSTQDTAAVNSLTANLSFPNGNITFFVPSAEEKALGHFTGNSNTIDGYVAFGTGVAANSWTNVALHEITHAMGRVTLHYESNPVILDMFRYDAPGHFQWTEGATSAAQSYFSINGGQTDLADFGVYSDYSDFLNPGPTPLGAPYSNLTPHDPFNELYGNDTFTSLTAVDITTMDVIGFDRAGAGPSPTDDFRNSLTDTTHPFGSVVVNGSSTGKLEVAGDRDWFGVQLNAGTTYVINLQGQQAGGGTLEDPYLRLHNSAGTVLSENDDIVNGVNRDSQLSYSVTASGTYYLEAGAFNDGYTGTYRIGVTVAASADDFRNSLTDTSHPFGSVVINGSSTGNLEITGDRDWFQVQLNAGTTYLINLQGQHAGGGTLEDPYLRLHDGSGALLALNDDIVNGVNRDSQLSYSITTTGTYYLEAGAFDDSYTGTYRISVSGSATTDDFRDSLTDTTAPFGSVAVNGSSTGTLETTGDRDWFSIQLNAATTYDINLQGLQAGAGTLEDPYLRIHNSSGTLVAENDDIDLGINRDSHLIFQATTTGTYYIEAGAFDDNYTGTYRASITSVGPGSVTINDVSITEGNSGTKIETFTVTRSGGTAAFGVNFTTVDGSATIADHDYFANSGTLNFAAGVSTQTISVAISGDTKIEANETFFVNLSGATNGAIISDSFGSGTIIDDDGNHVRDFNADGHSDILWQNANGTPAVWLMNGTSAAAFGPALANSGPAWHEKTAADFNGDGKADILWQNDNGTPAVWLMNGTSAAAFGPALANPGPAWHETAAADFNGDGKADILWQNDNGTPGVWLMDGTGVAAFGPGLVNPGPAWHEKAAADFNGDGKADILWQNDNGAAAVWLMDGTNVAAFGPALTNPGPAWHATAAGDFNGDGKADILWQNDNGTPAVWLMDGTNVAAFGPALANPGPAWHEKAAADFSGDGKADILWQNDNGTPEVWLMNGTSVSTFGAPLPDPGSDWHII